MAGVFWLFLFFLPAGLANMAPVFANKIPYLNRWKTPMDFGKKIKGKRISGDNKTWRGLVFGTFIGGVVACFEAFIFFQISSADTLASYAVVGASMGFGALSGDAIESFFKRQMGIKSGESWFPFDQSDYIVGGLVASLLFVRLPLLDYVYIFLIYFGLHLATSYIGYKLHLKNKPI
jgi:CDP-2,3-bis-(O-geranylgeranyl)-sn-glycerol synthase